MPDTRYEAFFIRLVEEGHGEVYAAGLRQLMEGHDDPPQERLERAERMHAALQALYRLAEESGIKEPSGPRRVTG